MTVPDKVARMTDEEAIEIIVAAAPPVSDEVMAKLRDLLPPVEIEQIPPEQGEHK